MKAFNLRGTNGSGKTTVARHLLTTTQAKPVVWEGKKVRVYKGSYMTLPFYILGSYKTDCGGCDTIPKVQIVADLLDQYMHKNGNGIVFYEGLMISHMIGTVGAAAKPYERQHIMGFLDTPLDMCIERVKARRRAKGNLAPFDPARTLIKDYKAVQAAQINAVAQGFRVVTVPHQRAIKHVIGCLEMLLDET